MRLADRLAPLTAAAVLAATVGCGDDRAPASPDAGPIAPGRDLTRDVLDTDLAVDLQAMTATATIRLAPSPSAAATFEIGDLDVDAVTLDGAPLEWADRGDLLDVGVPPSTEAVALTVAYHWHYHGAFDGASAAGWTLDWPYYCGNLFPCHSDPADGTRFTLALTGVPDGDTAVFPAAIPGPAPSYMLAWALGPYTRLDLGTTTAGTRVGVWYIGSREASSAAAGTAHLRDAFDWYERTLGPYRFGGDVGSVAVSWGPGQFGGMEHHPYWHVASGALGDEVTHVHEAAHGWFGDGVRIRCWEDFVLSEGTVSYLAARALTVTAGPARGDAVWQQYASELAGLDGTEPVWPTGCDQIDVLDDGLFSNAPYMRGAFFYKAVADRVGADALDQALGDFYRRHVGQAASMRDMLSVIAEDTGYDPTACAAAWLRSPTIPAPGPCP
jgi:aminopeptidase N